jgi:arylsulfatase A-like enzyme
MKHLKVLVTFWLGSLAGLAASEEARPNIIVVLADDMGFSELGCYGSEIRTPHIDKLAREGLRFAQFYNFALCGPSRAALMSGCYPWQVGQRPGASIFLNLTGNCVTLTQLLKANGYATCAVGRLDMVTADDWHDPAQVARWVDSMLGSASGGAGNYYRQVDKTPWFKDGKVWERPAGPYSTDLISGQVEKFIEDSAASTKPFFIYMAHYAPHWPLQADEKDIAPYRDVYAQSDRRELMQARLRRQIQMGLIPASTGLAESAVNPPGNGAVRELPRERMAINAAMITTIDHSVGRIMAALRKAGKLDNTLILVLSDNGAGEQMALDRPVPPQIRPGSADTFLNQGAELAGLSNTPFHGYKRDDHEGGIATPLVAWWPRGLRNPGRISHRLSHVGDIMPTCLELAHIAYPAQFEGRTVIPLAGTSFADVLRANPNPQVADRVVVWPTALRQGDWKLVMGNPAAPELYNLAHDRNEQRNLAAEHPERLRQMKELHARLGPPAETRKAKGSE